MDHGEARARLIDAAAVRGGVEALLGGDPELAAHLAACPACSREAHAWSSTSAALASAFPSRSAGTAGARDGAGAASADQPVPPMPAELRTHTLAFVRERGVARTGNAAATTTTATATATASRAVTTPDRAAEAADRAPEPAGVPPSPRDVAAPGSTSAAPTAIGDRLARIPRARSLRRIDLRALAAAAVVVIMLGSGAVVVDANHQRDAARAQTEQLGWVVDELGKVMADPGHRAATLADATGRPAGTVAWSPASRELVVVTTALSEPALGSSYQCWVERGGVRQTVGAMEFAGGEAYWAGLMESGVTIAPGTRFGVTLVSGASMPPNAPAVLTATF